MTEYEPLLINLPRAEFLALYKRFLANEPDAIEAMRHL
jgi:hypothetical protein